MSKYYHVMRFLFLMAFACAPVAASASQSSGDAVGRSDSVVCPSPTADTRLHVVPARPAALSSAVKLSEEHQGAQPSLIDRKSKRVPWGFGLHVAPNYAIPVGSLFDFSDPGLGFQADVVVPLFHEVSVRVSVSSVGVRRGQTAFSRGSDDQVTRYLISLQNNEPLSKRRPLAGLKYSYVGMGMLTTSRGGSDGRFMAEIGGGGVYFLSRGFGFEGGGGAGFVWGKESDGETSISVLCSISVGLSYWFKSGDK